MNNQLLPKKRGQQVAGGSRNSSNRVGSIHDLSNKGRAISGRVNSKRVISNNRHVSRGDLFTSGTDEANNSLIDDAIHFHENKHTILTNFEEWIKLSTDNKITSKNSWQFALIDYFHDLNVIKDGENINFQRASATLDGCVKIYLSRVESVASETGKLLSGLATKKHQNNDENNDDNDENDEDDNADESQNEEGIDGKRKRKINRVLESTLVPFDTIKIKKLDEELAIDPLFKKALAEFDEGGAKSLLLNTLSIDASGRVIFDATTTQNKQASDEEDEDDEEDNMVVDKPSSQSNINVNGLLKFLFNSSVDELDNIVICPSLNELKVVLNDVNQAKSVLTGVNLKFIADEEKEMATPSQADEDQFGFPDYDDDAFIDNDVGGAHEDEDDGSRMAGFFQGVNEDEEILTTKVLDRDLMAYFDERMKTNWRGPEHWKVSALKKAKNLIIPQELEADANGENGEVKTPQPTAAKKKKEGIIINFSEVDDDDIEELIFQRPKNTQLLLKKPDERTSESKNKLPQDIQFNSHKLTNLFVKSQMSITHFSKKAKVPNESDEAQTMTDENYFANKYQKEEEERRQQEQLAMSFQQAEYDDYDNDDFGGIDFNDALGDDLQDAMGEGGIDNDAVKQETTPLITGGRRARPEYVNFSRVAKRVDVKLLKDNLWKSIKIEEEEHKEKTPEIEPVTHKKTFGNVITSIGKMYRTEERKDLSTSFCFICLLHLANEHGLLINSNQAHDDLQITGF